MTKIGEGGISVPQQPGEKIPSVTKHPTFGHNYAVQGKDHESELAKKVLEEKTESSTTTTAHKITAEHKEIPIATEDKILRTESGIIIGIEVVEKAVNLIKAMGNKRDNTEVNKIMQGETKDTILALVGMCLKSPKASDMTFLHDLKYHLNKNFPGVESSLLNNALKQSTSLETERFEIMGEYESEKTKIEKELNAKPKRTTPKYIEEIAKKREEPPLYVGPKIAAPKEKVSVQKIEIEPLVHKNLEPKELEQLADHLMAIKGAGMMKVADRFIIIKHVHEPGQFLMVIKEKGNQTNKNPENPINDLIHIENGEVKTEKYTITIEESKAPGTEGSGNKVIKIKEHEVQE